MTKKQFTDLIKECIKEVQISSHLNTKSFQVAVTTDPTLPLRKWDHKGTTHEVSSISAAYKFGEGTLVGNTAPKNTTGTVYKFEKNFVYVGF